MSLAVSIVAYHHGEELREVINCVLKANLQLRIYLIDNSKTDQLRAICDDPKVSYIFNDANLGYGAGHNMAIKRAMAAGYKYHLVINPDISFAEKTLEQIYDFMEKNPDVGSVMPKIYYPDGSLQRLCKLLPAPSDLIFRRFFGNTPNAVARNKIYELHEFDYNNILNTPCLSGCFMFIRSESLQQVGYFDERFFMYLEDYDLTRRINKISRTIFYPDVSIVHVYDKGSYKNFKLLGMHVISAIKYFNKWGWWRDTERDRLNQQVLNAIHTKH